MMTRKEFLRRAGKSAAAIAVMARFPGLAGAQANASNALLAGVAKKAITPGAAELAGLAKSNPRWSGKVAEEIFARVVVLGNASGQKLVLVSAELPSVSSYNDLTSRIAAKYKLDKSACIVGVTQNHQAPAGAKLDAATAGAIVDAVGEAIAAMQPARLAFERGSSNINAYVGRMTTAGWSKTMDFGRYADKELTVLRVDDLNGKTLGLFVNYPMQSNIFEACSKDVSGDVAGSISAYVERRLGCVCAWTAGASAEVYPLATGSVSSPVYSADGKLTIEQKQLSVEVTEHLRRYLTATQGLDILRLNSRMTRFSTVFTLRSAEVKYSAAGRKGKVGHRLHLAVVNDDIAFAATNANASAKLGRMVKDALPYRTAFLASEGEVIGYVVDVGTDPRGLDATGSVAADASESERIYVDGFRKLSRATKGQA